MFGSGKRPSRAERNIRALDTSHLEGRISSKVTQGGLVGVAATLLVVALQLASAAVLARILEPDDFGLIAMAMVVTGFVGLFTDAGLSTATIQRKEISQDLVSGLLFINLALGTAIMLVVWAVAPAASVVFGDERVFLLTVVLAITLPLAAAGAQHNAILNRQMRWHSNRLILVIGQATAFVTGVFSAAVLDWGYWSLATAAISQRIVHLVLSWMVVDWRPSFVRDWTAVRDAAAFGANLTLFKFANWFNRNLDNALIGWRWGAAPLGYYTRAYQLLTLPITLVSGPISAAVIPALSRFQDDHERWRKGLLEAMSAVFFVSYLIATIMIAASSEIILLFYGPGWQESADIFFVLAISMLGATITNITGWIFITLGQADRMAKWGFLYLPFVVIGFAIGVQFGPKGVALSLAIIQTIAVFPCLMFATHRAPVQMIEILHRALGPVLLAISIGLAARSIPVPDLSGLSEFTFWRLLYKSSVCLFAYASFASLLIVFLPAYAPIKRRLVNELQRLKSQSNSGRGNL